MPRPIRANTPAARALRYAGLTIADAQDGVYTRLRRLDDVPDWRYGRAPDPGAHHRVRNILTGKVRPEHCEGGALADVLQALPWDLRPDAYASSVPVTRTAPPLQVRAAALLCGGHHHARLRDGHDRHRGGARHPTLDLPALSGRCCGAAVRGWIQSRDHASSAFNSDGSSGSGTRGLDWTGEHQYSWHPMRLAMET
jgi:hypothetical protein